MYKSKFLNDYELHRHYNGIPDSLEVIEYFYNVNGNAYHNMQHLDNVFYAFEKKYWDKLSSRDREIITIAILYHDVIYDPQAKDNEEKSADFMLQCGGDIQVKDEAYKLILFSKYQRKPETELERIFLECDMHIFSETLADQLEYEKQIQQEYAWVPLEIYIKERVKILEKINEMYGVNTFDLVHYLENKTWNIGIYFGSFNPLHKGHKSIIEQAEKMFDKVILAQGISENIKTDIDTKIEYKINNEMLNYDGLITDFIKSYKYNFTIIRGIRNHEDLLYEQNFSKFIKDIIPNQNIIYLFSDPQYNHISSSMIRKLYKYDKQLIKNYL